MRCCFPFTQRESMTHLFYETVQTFFLVNFIFMHQTPLPLDTDDSVSLTFDCRCCFCSLFMIHSFCIFKKKHHSEVTILCAHAGHLWDPNLFFSCYQVRLFPLPVGYILLGACNRQCAVCNLTDLCFIYCFYIHLHFTLRR